MEVTNLERLFWNVWILPKQFGFFVPGFMVLLDFYQSISDLDFFQSIVEALLSVRKANLK